MSSQPEAAEIPLPTLKQVVEACLFVGTDESEWVEVAQIAALAEATRLQLPSDSSAETRGMNRLARYLVAVRQTIAGLETDYQRVRSPITVQVRNEWARLWVRFPYERLLEQLREEKRQTSLSPAALEVLSAIAYRAPLPLGELQRLRGQPAQGLVRQLIRLGLVEEIPSETGAEVCLQPTQRFLEVSGLRQLADLPRIQDLERL